MFEIIYLFVIVLAALPLTRTLIATSKTMIPRTAAKMYAASR